MLWFELKDSSGLHRLEEVESRIEMMYMMSQLLEAKLAGGGQQKEKEDPRSTGRGTTTAAAPGGRRLLLTQVMVL